MRNYEKLTNFSEGLVFRELFFGTANPTYLFLTFVSLNVFFPLSNFITYSDNFFVYVYPKKNPSELFLEQRVKTNEQRAKSNGQQGKTNEQRAKTNEQPATSKKFHLTKI